MAISAYTTFADDEILDADDLNASFNQIINNATALVSPFTDTVDLNGNVLTIDTDGDAKLAEVSDDVLAFRLSSTDLFKFDMSTASSVNGLTFASAAASGDPSIAAHGSDTDISIAWTPKGAGTVKLNGFALTLDADDDSHLIATSDDVIALRKSSTDLFKFDMSTASAVNGMTFGTSATGTKVTITAQGSDTDLDVDLVPKGAGEPLLDGVALLGGHTLRNYLYNPTFRFWQRFGATVTSTNSANNDDTFFCDRWIILSDGNDIVDLSRESTTVPTRAATALKCDVETANKKFGIFQPLEYANTTDFRGSVASLTFKARITGSTIGAIRAGIVQWTSTADSITSDIVSAWNAAGSNPTLATNWAFANTPAALTAPTTSYQTYRIENVSISSSATNIGVFIWTDDVTMDVADLLYIADVGLYLSPRVPTFNYCGPREDLANCQRYYEKTFGLDVAAVNDTGDSTGALATFAGTAIIPTVFWKFAVAKRVAPTVTTYNYRSGADSQWQSTGDELGAARATDVTQTGVRIDNTTTVATSNAQYFIHAAATAEL